MAETIQNAQEDEQIAGLKQRFGYQFNTMNKFGIMSVAESLRGLLAIRDNPMFPDAAMQTMDRLEGLLKRTNGEGVDLQELKMFAISQFPGMAEDRAKEIESLLQGYQERAK